MYPGPHLTGHLYGDALKLFPSLHIPSQTLPSLPSLFFLQGDPGPKGDPGEKSHWVSSGLAQLWPPPLLLPSPALSNPPTAPWAPRQEPGSSQHTCHSQPYRGGAQELSATDIPPAPVLSGSVPVIPTLSSLCPSSSPALPVPLLGGFGCPEPYCAPGAPPRKHHVASVPHPVGGRGV